MIDIKLLQEYINGDLDRARVVVKKLQSDYTRHGYDSITIEELVGVSDDNIICQVITSKLHIEKERIAMIKKSDFLSWIREDKINILLDENLG